MRTTIDIPDQTYKEAKILAAQTGTTVRQLVLQGLGLVLRRPAVKPKKLQIPLIPTTRADKLNIDNEAIYDLIDFP